jgi:MFS family permease
LAKAGLSYANVPAPAGTAALVRIRSIEFPSFRATSPTEKEDEQRFNKALGSALREAGYPAHADPAQINWPMALLILICLGLLITATYGPVAAVLAEMFPTRIRYTAVSLPYNIGNGWFGGFLPATAFAIVAARGDIYAGLWYPIAVISITFVIGLLFLPETKGVSLETEPADTYGRSASRSAEQHTGTPIERTDP